MAIIISKNGKGAIKLNKIAYGLEDRLQQYIHNNPESIPLYDIKEDVQLLILAREFQTGSGPIDAFGVDKEGEIYLVETKLYKNPDKRTVVAQVLDYGASLWKSHPDFDSFLLRLNTAVQDDFSQTVRERLQSFYSLDEEATEALLANMQANLNGGNFKFVVLMDSMHDQLKDLILYMNQNSKFDIYGVELEYYKHDEFEIIIPKLFGAEVKKDVGNKKSDSTYISDEEFISHYKDSGLENNVQEIFNLKNMIHNGKTTFKGWYADRTPKYINFFYKSTNRSKMSLVLSIGYNRKNSPDLIFSLWLYDRDIEEKVLAIISTLLEIQTTPLAMNAKYGVVGKWSIKDFSKDKLLKLFSTLS
jgi:hypothetical protein